MAKPRTLDEITDGIVGRDVTYTTSNVNVHTDRIDGSLDIRAYARDADGKPVTVTITVAPDAIPRFMQAVVQAGTSVMKDIADAWRRGDCDTCGNRRLVDVTRPNGHKTNDYCPDCNGPAGTTALEGFPTLRKPGSQEEREARYADAHDDGS